MAYDTNRRGFVAHYAGWQTQRILYIDREDGTVNECEVFGNYVRGQFCLSEEGDILGIRRIDRVNWGLVDVGNGERDICVLRTVTESPLSSTPRPVVMRYEEGDVIVHWSDGAGRRANCITGEVSELTGIEVLDGNCDMVIVRDGCIQSLSGVINIWSRRGNTYALLQKCPFRACGGPRFAEMEVAEGATSVFGCDESRICRLEFANCRYLWDSDIPTAYPDSMRISSDGNVIGVGGIAGEVTVLKTSNGSILHALRHGDRGVAHVAFSPEGKYVAAVSTNGSVRGWDDGKEIWVFDTKTEVRKSGAIH